jgi:ACR3 family arsenite efflux pump ArsB
MGIIAKLQPLFIILSALVGIIIGRKIDGLVLYSNYIIHYSLMILLLFVFLNINIAEIKKSFLNIQFSISALAINFLWTPVFTYLLSLIFFNGKIDVQLGFIMLMVTPCTDWYLIFTGLSKGNVALGSSILPLNLILQIVLLPVYILVFMGSAVELNPSMILESLVFVLIIPLVLANIIKLIIAKLPIQETFNAFISTCSDTIQFLFLCLAVIAMFSSQGGLLLQNPQMFLTIFPPLLIFFAANFFIAWFTGTKLHLSFADKIPLIFTTAARNSPISLAIASVTFPTRPIVSLVLVIGPLIELPTLAVIAAALRWAGRGFSNDNRKGCQQELQQAGK